MPENAANRPANPAAPGVAPASGLAPASGGTGLAPASGSAGGTALTAHQWRVSPAAIVFKGLGALAFLAAAALFVNDPARVLVAGAAGALLAAYALRDVFAPVRLAADLDGVTVISGYAGRRRIPWAQIERVRLDQRSRLGMRQELLEIDAGESLHLFSPSDLNAPLVEVVEALGRIRQLAARRPDTAGS
jgi:hypothetical protein